MILSSTVSISVFQVVFLPVQHIKQQTSFLIKPNGELCKGRAHRKLHE